MKKLISLLLIITLLTACFTSCSSAQILKGKYFSDEYRSFLRNMRGNPPVSVEFEKYLKKDGFNKQKLITNNDSALIQSLVSALAEVKIVSEVKSGSNFSVKYYCFTTEKGEKFVFEFFGKYLKVENKLYQTDNYVQFTNIQILEKKNGSVFLSLDEVREGRGFDESEDVYIGAKELKVKGTKIEYLQFNSYALSKKAEIVAPESSGSEKSKTYTPEEFMAAFEELKGEKNPTFIFKAEIKDDVILKLTFDKNLSENATV